MKAQEIVTKRSREIVLHLLSATVSPGIGRGTKIREQSFYTGFGGPHGDEDMFPSPEVDHSYQDEHQSPDDSSTPGAVQRGASKEDMCADATAPPAFCPHPIRLQSDDNDPKGKRAESESGASKAIAVSEGTVGAGTSPGTTADATSLNAIPETIGENKPKPTWAEVVKRNCTAALALKDYQAPVAPVDSIHQRTDPGDAVAGHEKIDSSGKSELGSDGGRIALLSPDKEATPNQPGTGQEPNCGASGEPQQAKAMDTAPYKQPSTDGVTCLDSNDPRSKQQPLDKPVESATVVKSTTALTT
ncbi:hypothetical protein FN846DRAFT_913801 [Sphaerosporella brunnea]|uniref:Uncharacterized protein n=1 Tax=Sphaerosporella brunnea TaxID=1250544 RepID=A0A5J5EEM6_9PEZI|nr:hypothetical protein FN846DRAFT_913801 [Sphaerosporella brunnea]